MGSRRSAGLLSAIPRRPQQENVKRATEAKLSAMVGGEKAEKVRENIPGQQNESV